MRNFKSSPPVARLIGFRITSIFGGEASGELKLRPHHIGPGGTVHGGILCDLADAAMGLAFASTLPGRQSAATVELKINFLRPVWRGRLLVSARVAHRGRRLGMVESEVSDEAGRLIAKASSTCIVLPHPLRRRATPSGPSGGRAPSHRFS